LYIKTCIVLEHSILSGCHFFQVMVVAMAAAWVACLLEAQQLRLWLMEHTRFLVVAMVGTWEEA
jgi:hypothetical protein